MARESREPLISEEVLQAEYRSVYRYALALCQDESLAQDITQETFLKAMLHGHRFQGKSSLYTWLCAIAKNLWLNRLKKRSREVSPEDLEAWLPSPEPSLEELLEEKDLSMAIHRILHHLKEPYKEVFTLRVFGQLSFASIAALFSKTESWARVTYHRGRKQIIETLRKDGSL